MNADTLFLFKKKIKKKKNQTKEIILRNPVSVIALFYSRTQVASSQQPTTMASEYAYRQLFFSDNFMKVYTQRTGPMQAVFTAFFASRQNFFFFFKQRTTAFLNGMNISKAPEI